MSSLWGWESEDESYRGNKSVWTKQVVEVSDGRLLSETTTFFSVKYVSYESWMKFTGTAFAPFHVVCVLTASDCICAWINRRATTLINNKLSAWIQDWTEYEPHILFFTAAAAEARIFSSFIQQTFCLFSDFYLPPPRKKGRCTLPSTLLVVVYRLEWQCSLIIRCHARPPVSLPYQTFKNK